MEEIHVFLPPDLKEWAKHQEEGFAHLVRTLLAGERKRRERLARAEERRRQAAWGPSRPAPTPQMDLPLEGDEGLLLGR
jgi:hypothetical protein